MTSQWCFGIRACDPRFDDGHWESRYRDKSVTFTAPDSNYTTLEREGFGVLGIICKLRFDIGIRAQISVIHAETVSQSNC